MKLFGGSPVTCRLHLAVNFNTLQFNTVIAVIAVVIFEAISIVSLSLCITVSQHPARYITDYSHPLHDISC